MKKTIESKVADTILQKGREITIGETVYQVAPPSVATIIEVSELISQMPQIKLSQDPEEMVTETLRVARHCRIEGDILALLILGAGNTTITKTIKTKRLFGLITEEKEQTVNLQADLAKEILYKMSPSVLENETIKLLQGIGKEITAFFSLTTSLIEINLTKQTKEVVATIQSGQ